MESLPHAQQGAWIVVTAQVYFCQAYAHQRTRPYTTTGVLKTSTTHTHTHTCVKMALVLACPSSHADWSNQDVRLLCAHTNVSPQRGTNWLIKIHLMNHHMRTVMQEEILQCHSLLAHNKKEKTRMRVCGTFFLAGVFLSFSTKPCDSGIKLSMQASKDEHACMLMEMLPVQLDKITSQFCRAREDMHFISSSNSCAMLIFLFKSSPWI